MIKVWEVWHNCVNIGLLNSYIPILLLSTNVVMAASAYDPPPNQPSPIGPTTSTGTRGECPVSKRKPPTVLAPIKRVGLTVSSHPTFTWFVQDNSTLSIKFRLLEYSSDKLLKVVQEIPLQSSPGIMKLSLPEAQPGLALGKRYRWQVRVICDSNHPSGDLVAQAEIEVIEKPQNLKSALSAAKNHLEIAQVYGKSGIWYDAISEALENSEDLKIKKFASTMLEELGELEEPEQRANLMQVVVSK